jgi:hypothetical protein
VYVKANIYCPNAFRLEKPSWRIKKKYLLSQMQEQLDVFLRRHSVLPVYDREANLRAAIDIIRQAKTYQTTPYSTWVSELKRLTRRGKSIQKSNDKQVRNQQTKRAKSRKPKPTTPEQKTALTNAYDKKCNQTLVAEPIQAPTKVVEPIQAPTIQAPTMVVEQTNEDLDYVVCDAEQAPTNCAIL